MQTECSAKPSVFAPVEGLDPTFVSPGAIGGHARKVSAALLACCANERLRNNFTPHDISMACAALNSVAKCI